MGLLQIQLDQLDYDDSKVEELEGEKQTLNRQLFSLREKVEGLESRWVPYDGFICLIVKKLI